MFARQTSKKRTLADVKWLSSKDIKKYFYSFRKMTSKLPYSAKFYYSTHLCVPYSYRHINSTYPKHFLFSLNLHSRALENVSPSPLFIQILSPSLSSFLPLLLFLFLLLLGIPVSIVFYCFILFSHCFMCNYCIPDQIVSLLRTLLCFAHVSQHIRKHLLNE